MGTAVGVSSTGFIAGAATGEKNGPLDRYGGQLAAEYTIIPLRSVKSSTQPILLKA